MSASSSVFQGWKAQWLSNMHAAILGMRALLEKCRSRLSTPWHILRPGPSWTALSKGRLCHRKRWMSGKREELRGTNCSSLLFTKSTLPGADQTSNVLRLEAFIKIRQASRDWRSTLQGYEWLTETRNARWQEVEWDLCFEHLCRHSSFLFPILLGIYQICLQTKEKPAWFKVYIYNL